MFIQMSNREISSNCKQASETRDHFRDLSLELRGSSLHSGLCCDAVLCRKYTYILIVVVVVIGLFVCRQLCNIIVPQKGSTARTSTIKNTFNFLALCSRMIAFAC